MFDSRLTNWARILAVLVALCCGTASFAQVAAPKLELANKSDEMPRKSRKTDKIKSDGKKDLRKKVSKQSTGESRTEQKTPTERMLKDLEQQIYQTYVKLMRAVGLDEYILAQKEVWKLYTALFSSIFFFFLGVYFWSQRRVPIPVELDREDEVAAESGWHSLIRPRSRQPINSNAVDALMRKAIQANRESELSGSVTSLRSLAEVPPAPQQMPSTLSAGIDLPPIASKPPPPSPKVIEKSESPPPAPRTVPLAATFPTAPTTSQTSQETPPTRSAAPTHLGDLEEASFDPPGEFSRESSESSAPRRVSRHPSVPMPPPANQIDDAQTAKVQENFAEFSMKPEDSSGLKSPVLDLFGSMQSEITDEIELRVVDIDESADGLPESHAGVLLSLADLDQPISMVEEPVTDSVSHPALALDVIAITVADVLASVHLYSEIVAHFESWKASGDDCYELLHDRYQLTWIDWKDITREWQARIQGDAAMAERFQQLRDDFLGKIRGTRDVS